MPGAEERKDIRRVVVLGAGFGGVYVARGLHRRCHAADNIRMTVVNRENYFLFTPLLHEVATGGLAPNTIVEPLRSILGCGHTDIVLGEAQRVRLADKVVVTSAGEVAYDTLVVALGAETNYYGTPGAEQHAHVLKSMRDAIGLKQRCIDLFEAASAEPDRAKREALLRFVVVGGGPTGVELAAELSEFVSGSLLPLHRASLGGVSPRLTLLQAAPELLPQFTAVTRGKALTTLRAKGVDVRLNAAVTAVDAAGVTLAGGEHIPAAAAVWVAGVRPTSLAFDAEIERDRGGRIVVDATLRLKGRDDVFVIGDIACATARGDSAPLPPFAQVATRQAAYVAAAIADSAEGRAPAPFAYRHAGNMVSIGQWMAAAEIGPFRFWGHFAWWMWRTVYLTKFISIRKKFSIALQWTVNLFTSRDVTRI